MGRVPDDNQRVLLNGIHALDERDRSVAFEVVLIACRQNIKTSTLEMSALGWLFLFNVNLIVWTAHRWDAVDETVLRFDEMISGRPWLARQVRQFNRARRQVEITTRRGGRMMFATRTAGSGRALTGEKVIIDEGWKAKVAHTGGLIPTMSARSMTGDPQILYGSSAAHPDSEVLHPLIRRGRAAAAGGKAAELERRLMYAEWCAPPPAEACQLGDDCAHALDVPGCGCDNPVMVGKANPAHGRRISMEFILGSERRSMDPHEYGRERMGWHDHPASMPEVIGLADWAEGLDPKSEPAGTVALAVVYTSDKRRACIGLAGRRADGGWHVEIADYLDNTGHVTQRVKQIISKAAKRGVDVLGPAVDGRAHEQACIKPLTAARVDVVTMKTGDVTEAYGGFFEAVTQARNVHHRGQEELTVAMAAAGARQVGDAGEAWGRKGSGQEIAPVVAVTNAMWLFAEREPQTGVEPGAWAL